mmetsp:Transcript_28886/g.69416  ORF Transcript_28886/g.69416 Transcript_28886/m.69416 type:complete len:205 (-) Transcript_28886:11-625(-)
MYDKAGTTAGLCGAACSSRWCDVECTPLSWNIRERKLLFPLSSQNPCQVPSATTKYNSRLSWLLRQKPPKAQDPPSCKPLKLRPQSQRLLRAPRICRPSEGLSADWRGPPFHPWPRNQKLLTYWPQSTRRPCSPGGWQTPPSRDQDQTAATDLLVLVESSISCSLQQTQGSRRIPKSATKALQAASRKEFAAATAKTRAVAKPE